MASRGEKFITVSLKVLPTSHTSYEFRSFDTSTSFSRWLTKLECAVALKTASAIKDRAVALTVTVACWLQFFAALISINADSLYRGGISSTHIIYGFITLVIGILPLLMKFTGRVYTIAMILCLTTLASLTSFVAGHGGIVHPVSIFIVLPVFWGWLMFSIRGSVPIAILTLCSILFLTFSGTDTPNAFVMPEFLGLTGAQIVGLSMTILILIAGITATVAWFATRAHEAELVRGRDEAQQANRAKSEFIASIAHEVRTPLTGLMGMLELLAKEELDRNQSEMADTAKSSARNILNIINDLLDLSKIEVGELRLLPEPVDVASLFQETLSGFRQMVLDKGLEFSASYPDSSLWLLLDPVRFRQILSNFLSNAIKFTDKGFIRSRIQCEELETGEIKLRLTVEDSGPGIPAPLRRKIFGRFVQVDATQKAKHSGTGLGLAIVSDLARLQGGDVWVESTEGKGSTFFFECVFKRTSPLELPAASLLGNDRSEMTVLIADDSAGNQRVLTRVLQALGYRTRSVANGSDAIIAIIDHKIDLVLMDFNMPIKDGPTALKDIRSLPDERRNTPVIGLSADNSEADMKRWIDAGVDGFVQKPVDFGTLDLSIRRVLGVQRSTSVEDAGSTADQ